MDKRQYGLPPGGQPAQAPPSYAQAVGGVAPSSPYTPIQTSKNGPTIMTTVVPLGPEHTHMICPHCLAEIDTTIDKKPGLIAYIAGFLICLIGCPFGCCLIPCCISKCMDVHHSCPNCKGYLGMFRR
ncbi:PREDICTED: cell death-inducing p53-target protein 1-like [Nicrophorus vespilloides]|uniref:Cell death-inducing p53-target protein 1-like n=1 Tax=Nicrophorus vespilloides TaxID=110193 RepID=A0ABM1MPY2_NICVS|nr:PREDICTED: cell death-inducing p53-target protein 1-like [Nicrophorus vespilloides]